MHPAAGGRHQRVQSPWWGSQGVAPGCAVTLGCSWGAAQSVWSPWGTAWGWHQSVRLPWGPCRQQRARAQARQSELQKALSEDKLSFIHVVLKNAF